MRGYYYTGARYMGASRFAGTGSSEDDKLLIRLFALSVIAVIAMYGWLIYSRNFGPTWLVSTSTFPLYLTTVVVWLWGIFWWRKNPNFSKPELAFYMSYTVIAVYPTVCMGFMYLTDLGDIEVWNGTAQRVVWTEAHYTESTDKDGNKSKTHYSASYSIKTSNDESVSTDKETFETYVRHWGGWGRISTSRLWSADGEDWPGSNHNGIPEEHTVSWDGNLTTRVPTAVEHRYANYLKASDSVEKIRGIAGGWKSHLVEYPRVHSGTMGNIYFNRVIMAGTQVPGNFQNVVQHELTEALCTLGARKECNILVYVVGTDQVGFYQALQEKWNMGKKNDIVVCIGHVNNEIQFCRVLTWSKHQLFIEKLEAGVRDLGTLNGKGSELCKVILSQISAPGDAGYLRRPMKELAYLAADVKMPIWAYMLVSLGGCVIMVPTILLAVKD